MDRIVTGTVTFQSLKPCNLSNTNKNEIRTYFENSYNLNESIFTALKDESVFYTCPDRLRLPLIFYYGHTAAVYVNKMILADLILPEDRVDRQLETIFETGVDEMSWDDTENFRMGGKFRWPDLDVVVAYRKRVRDLIMKVIDATPLELPITEDSPWWALFMGMEHERIHIETSSVLIRQLPVDLVEKPYNFTYGPTKGPFIVKDNSMITLPASKVVLGKPRDFPSYGWDNEYGCMEYSVPSFCASKYMITNRQFYEFVKAGGYDNKEYWTAEGWQWKEYCEANHPIFWVCDKGCKSRCGAKLADYSHCKPEQATEHLANGQNSYCNGHETTDGNGHQGSDEGGGYIYRLRCMFDVVGMAWDWPVEVNFHEAKAFAKWKGAGYRLLTEAEHKVIHGDSPAKFDDLNSDILLSTTSEYNLNMHYGSSTPVNLFPPSSAGFHDVFGNAWEWAEDHYNGFPGFRTSNLYDDYSTPCFDGRHNVIMGGSWISTGDLASRFARYAFRRHFMQHCGFRVTKTIDCSEGKLPVCRVNTHIYIQGHGELADQEDVLDEPTIDAVPSSATHYCVDNKELIMRCISDEYGDSGENSRRVYEQIKSTLDNLSVKKRKFIHLGCGAGSLSFLLAKECRELLAIDTSGRLVDVCLKLQKGDATILKYNLTSLPDAAADKIIFKEFNWLPNEVGFHDVAVCTFFHRVQNVDSWILRLREIVNPGGIIFLVLHDESNEEKCVALLRKSFSLLDSSIIKLQDGANQKLISWRKD